MTQDLKLQQIPQVTLKCGTLLSVIRRKGEDRNPVEPFSKGKKGKGFRPIKSERRWQGLLWGSSGWDSVGPMQGARIRSPGQGARSHVRQLRPSVVTQVTKIYLFKKRERGNADRGYSSECSVCCWDQRGPRLAGALSPGGEPALCSARTLPLGRAS